MSKELPSLPAEEELSASALTFLDSSVAESSDIGASTATVTITGLLQWQDNAGNLHPIRNARIELWEADPFPFSDDYVTEGGTDSEGRYEFTVPLVDVLDLEFPSEQAGEVYIQVRSEPRNYPYNILTGGDAYYRYSSPVQIISAGGTYDVPKVFDAKTSEIGRAFSIYDAIFAAQQYGLAVFQETEPLQINTWQPPLLNINYPVSLEDAGGEYMPGSGNDPRLIAFSEEAGSNWDIILHEFGHYLADIDQLSDDFADAVVTLDHRIGVSNISGSVAEGIPALGKDLGTRLAWDEGLANYFSVAIQQFSMDSNLFPQGPPDVNVQTPSLFENVAIGSGDVASTVDFENNVRIIESFNVTVPLLSKGEGDELSITRILLDLADGQALPNEPDDEIQVTFTYSDRNVATGHIALYKILDQAIGEGELKRLSDLWNFFSEGVGLGYLGLPAELADEAKRAKLGKLFELNGVSPEITEFQDYKPPQTVNGLPVGQAQAPKVTWTIGNDNRNDTFTIMVFNDDFSEMPIEVTLDTSLLAAGEWSTSGTSAEWVPDVNALYGGASWQSLYQNSGTYHIVVAGADTDDFETGAYWSGAYSFAVEATPASNPGNPPVVNAAIADQVATVGEALSFTVPATAFFDPDPGDTLTYSINVTRDLVKNGSFEQGSVVDEFDYISLEAGSNAINHWTVTRDQIDYYQDEWIAADGDRSIDLNGSPGVGGMSQMLETEVGQDYLVTFDLAGHNSGLLQTLGVSAAGQAATFEFQANQDPSNLGWVERSWQFTAVAPETTVEFYSLQNLYAYGGPAIDDVSIVAEDAPLPDWLTFDPTTGTFSGTPLVGDEGAMVVAVTATDSTGAIAADEFVLVVESGSSPLEGSDIDETGATQLSLQSDTPFAFEALADDAPLAYISPSSGGI